jgi:hypothetical protein
LYARNPDTIHEIDSAARNEHKNTITPNASLHIILYYFEIIYIIYIIYILYKLF